MEIKVPEMGESITEGTIASWSKKEGDAVKFGELLLELETDKVNLEINAEADGILEKIYKNENDTVQVGEAVGLIRAGEASSAPAAAKSEAPPAAAKEAVSAPAQQQPVSAPAADAAAMHAPPSVRKLARERGISLQEASELTGKVSKEQIGNAGKPQAAPSQAAPAKTSASAESNPAKPVDRQKMSRRRQTIANRLVEAQRTAAMLTTFNEVDMTAIMEVRKRRKQSFQDKHNVNLGFMSFFTKAVVGALKAFPLLNAEIDGEDILVKKFYDIGIAVASKEGLVVPVVRDADRLSFAQIERSIGDLAGKARENKLALSDLQGGTFTITNGGVFGSLLSTPILNTPQVGILGMHTIQRRPVATSEDGMENRPMMYIALSYDHRIVDGSEAVRFLVTVKNLLEDPESLLLEG
ncbi:dihydrolipoamide succinyltransferase [Paenibacillus sp. 598K]|uniref:2-oxoglutarate dehydrogenase complex dihydrolipoyllysine-residue succinyltransferase n=1 Tax=Paenibacillus sp. 598K TaxID=1117987 RepID=UPI000FFA9687|nr:2-oxoglutarate dehydrogenase complex dihydrolipoyllysine-residue succinyltransferase [Paenibacillus sp. 598K]GBF74002.1 dihydrolipoamide succinyltransferase [Paenibacillus sp. 598K]